MQLSSVPFDYGVKALYTEEEFHAKRAQLIQEYAEDGFLEYEPVGDEPEFLKGHWCRSGFGWSGTRFYFNVSSGSTRPWLPRWYRGHDERCNPWLSIVLPFFLGEISIRTNRGPKRTYFSEPCWDCVKDIGHPRCPLDHHYHWPHCLPVEMVCPSCQGRFPSTTGFWSKAAPGDAAPCCTRTCADMCYATDT